MLCLLCGFRICYLHGHLCVVFVLYGFETCWFYMWWLVIPVMCLYAVFGDISFDLSFMFVCFVFYVVVVLYVLLCLILMQVWMYV